MTSRRRSWGPIFGTTGAIRRQTMKCRWLTLGVLCLSLMGCRERPERLVCTRDQECTSGELCYWDGACVGYPEAERLPNPIGEDCKVVDGVEQGCREGAFCRMGWCVREQAISSDGAVGPGDGAAGDGGQGGACVDRPDNFVPLFGGVSEALVDGVDAVLLRWFPAADETPPEAMVYTIFAGTSSAGLDQGAPIATLTGETAYRVEGLTTGTTYYFQVHATDAAGLSECNTKILEATPSSGPDCIDYTRDVQAIFDANCIRCHGGDMPRRELRLETYEGVLAGGLTGSEVVACRPESSLLFMKISMDRPPIGDRMPFDGPPYLTTTQIGRIEQWIREGARRSCTEPSVCNDQVAPTFGGLDSAAVTADGLGAQLCWTAATDDQTAAGDLRYDIFEATSAGGQRFDAPPRVISDAGATCTEVRGLTPLGTYCWVVRARDAAGNRDANTREQCVTMPAASCIDYAGVVQPIFDANCVRCHAGPTAPRNLHLDSYAGVIAGGLTGGEVVSCRAADSLLFQKISMATPPIGDRMPKDGPPYLAQAQIDIIAQWIDEGGRASCAEPDVCSDAVPPTFGGITSLTALDATRAELCWTAGSDNLTAPAALIYEVYAANTSGGQDFGARPRVTTAAGETCTTVAALSPGTNYCFVVRARDGAGNRDNNTVERCQQMGPLPACIDYATMVQPLFDYNCTRCHAGASAPQFLRLDRYEDVLAGSVRRSEVVACDPSASLLLGKVSASPPLGRRMPFDGPPYLTTQQQALLTQWVNEGARRSCAEVAGCSDTTPPTFAGVSSATGVDSDTIRVCWSAATDNQTPADALRYDVFESATPGGQAFNQPAQHAVVGDTCVDVATGPNVNLCFVVRATDRRGNRDANTVQLCAGTPNAACAVEYATGVQPILAARCAHCHSGANPPRHLDLSSLGAVFAGGALRSEVKACQPSQSYLNLKVSGATCGQQMPFDGPPYLAPSQRLALDRWVSSGARARCADPDPCSDATAPTFAGLTNATAIDGHTVELTWAAASDAISGPDAVVYEIWDAANPGSFALSSPAGYAAPAGATSIRIPVATDVQTCFLVRAKDARGNRDGNTVSRCVTPAAMCGPYQDLVQPIFDARCIQCHSGSNPPRGIRWDSYAHAAANDEVRACNADGSKIIDEIDGCTMPRDTTEACSIQACLTLSQRRLIREWIDTGASSSCPAGGCP